MKVQNGFPTIFMVCRSGALKYYSGDRTASAIGGWAAKGEMAHSGGEIQHSIANPVPVQAPAMSGGRKPRRKHKSKRRHRRQTHRKRHY